MIQAEQLHARILEELDLSRDIPDEELTELIHRVAENIYRLGKRRSLAENYLMLSGNLIFFRNFWKMMRSRRL